MKIIPDMPKTLYLIDGHAHIYRAFYAVEGLHSPDGKPTGAIFGFTRMLLDIIQNHKVDYLIAVFDAPGKTFRSDLYPEYKANRKPTPPELKEQIPVIMEVVKALGVPVIALEGVEADDVIGTLSVKATEANVNTVIVSGDKDCGQLLSKHVCLWDAQRDRYLTVESFTEKNGVTPEKLIDLMGLWGDTADNIPGVPGIGQKTGAKLIRDYGSLENLLNRAYEIKGKRGEILRASAEQARLSKELATIKTDLPLELDLAAGAVKQPDLKTLLPLFEELGFKSLIHQLGGEKKVEEEKRQYIVIDTPAKFESFYHALQNEKHFAVDTETTSLDPMLADLVGISLSWAPTTGYYLPFKGPEGEAVLGQAELEKIRTVLEDENVSKTGHNLKYDALVLRRAGIELNGITFDTLLASSILSGSARDNNLDALALKYFSVKKIPTFDLIGSGAKQVTMDTVPVEKVGYYACEDADIAYRLERKLAKLLIEDGDGARLLAELELPLSLVLTDMQRVGIRLDCDLLRKQSAEISLMLADLTAEIHELADHEFNIASPKQLAVVLFEEMNLPVVRKTKTGASTDEATLSELAAQGHALPSLVLEHRMYSKLQNTYLDALPLLLNPHTGRIHTTFSQTVTATGRLSSRDPNLQNIPVRSEKGRAVRAAFVPEEGWSMLAADYSQVELRMLAHYSGDEVLRQAFAEGKDIHRVVAAEIAGIDEDEVTREQRQAAKAVNFGIIYGQTAHGLSQTTDMNRPQAQLFIDSYFEQFPRVREWIDDAIAQAREAGYVKTMLGRRREIPDLNSSNKANQARAEREAVNTIIQGSAADLVKTAMVNLHAAMKHKTPRARMLLQIHDELVFECPPEEIEILRELVRAEMEHALPLAVPLLVDMGVGRNWLEVK